MYGEHWLSRHFVDKITTHSFINAIGWRGKCADERLHENIEPWFLQNEQTFPNVDNKRGCRPATGNIGGKVG